MNYLIPNNPFNPDRLYKLFILGCLIVLALIISDMFKSCSKSEHDAEINPIKETIKEDLKRKDSVKEVVAKKDSIRDVHHHHWHTIRKDSLIPCQTKLLVCDTLLIADSSLIASLKHEIKLSDTIISNYQKVVYNDSIVIIGLNKDLKKQKRKTKIVAAIAMLFGGIAAIK